jgi:plasmid stability protein
MPLLQVRDFPEELYAKLKLVAKRENRSITQQTIVIMREYLEERNSMEEHRKKIEGIFNSAREFAEQNPKLRECTLDPVALIREDRDR